MDVTNFLRRINYNEGLKWTGTGVGIVSDQIDIERNRCIPRQVNMVHWQKKKTEHDCLGKAME